MKKTITIVGGCGHIGIPLALVFADRGHKVTLLDVNTVTVQAVNAGRLPFKEREADTILKRVIGVNLHATIDPDVLRNSDVAVFATGHFFQEGGLHSPFEDLLEDILGYIDFLSPDQLVILRTTLFPGATKIIEKAFHDKFKKAKIAFCPERISQGYGLQELKDIPQIIAANNPQAESEATKLFSEISPQILRLRPEEAELAKLLCNSWRYMEFAIANQFYMLAESQGIDFYKVYNALKHNYPRASTFARPGLAGGPCLTKDTIQLVSQFPGQFTLGEYGLEINQRLPAFLVETVEKKIGPLRGKSIAILGMTFKADSDDTRASLSFRLKDLLENTGAHVICSDENLKNMTPLGEALQQADAIVIGVPHREYLKLQIDKPFVDCWGIIKPETQKMTDAFDLEQNS